MVEGVQQGPVLVGTFFSARLSLLDANASYTSSKVGHPGKRSCPSRALRLPASESIWRTPAAPFHTP